MYLAQLSHKGIDSLKKSQGDGPLQLFSWCFARYLRRPSIFSKWKLNLSTVEEHACVPLQEVLFCPWNWELELGITSLGADRAWEAQAT